MRGARNQTGGLESLFLHGANASSGSSLPVGPRAFRRSRKTHSHVMAGFVAESEWRTCMTDSAPLILLIEDEEDLRDAVATLLEMEGYRVAQCIHGEDAWSWLASHPRPGLVLLDLMMPVMNGQAFLARLSQERMLEGVPIIVLSGSPFHPPGAVAYLRKPVAVGSMMEVVRRFLPSSGEGPEGPHTS
ncbi:response regulator [Corallococcus sp. AB011P]|nr:response regulator [Corallococcus sp. AB011P]